MAARIAERAHAAVGAADGEDRRPDDVAGDVRPRAPASAADGQKAWVLLRSRVELGGEARGRPVVLDRLAPAGFGHVGRPVVDVIENALHDGSVVHQLRHREASSRAGAPLVSRQLPEA